MPRKLTATTLVLFALVLAGCGKDDSSGSDAPSASTPTTAPATTTATTTTAKKASPKTKTSGRKTASKTAGSKSPKTTTTGSATTAKKATATKKTPKSPSVVTGVTPKKTATTDASPADTTSGTGSGPGAERQAVVFVLRRYYRAFLDKDGPEVCSLLTKEGRATMIADGGEKTCAASAERLVKLASADNLKLLEATRDGIHVDDVTVTGNGATAQIGKSSRLKLSQVNGRWLVRSPNVEQTNS